MECNSYFILLYKYPWGTTISIPTSYGKNSNTNGNINSNTNSKYIGWRNFYDSYNWTHSNKMCNQYFGSNLASIHSKNDSNSILQSIPQLDIPAWVGLTATRTEINIGLDQDADKDSDEQIVSVPVWTWVDNTEYNYDVNPTDKMDGIDRNCVEIYGNHSNFNLYKASKCASENKQFICDYQHQSWPLNYYLSDVSHWPSPQVVSQLYYVVFILLFYLVFVICKNVEKGICERFESLLFDFMTDLDKLCGILLLSSLLMECWLSTWNPVCFDVGFSYAFGIMYIANKGVIFNGICYLSLRYQMNRLINGKSSFYAYIQVYHQSHTDITSQNVLIEQDSQPQLQQNGMNNNINNNHTHDDSHVHSNSQQEHNSQESIQVELQVNENNNQNNNKNDNILANNDHMHDSKIDDKVEPENASLMSNTYQSNIARFRMIRPVTFTRKSLRPPSINTSTIKTGDSVLLEYAHDTKKHDLDVYFLNNNAQNLYIPKSNHQNESNNPNSENSDNSSITISNDLLLEEEEIKVQNGAEIQNVDAPLHAQPDYQLQLQPESEEQIPIIVEVECGLSLAAIKSLIVWMAIFFWWSFVLFICGYFLTLWNYNWFISRDKTSQHDLDLQHTTWIVGYFASYHSKNLITLGLILIVLTKATVKACKDYLSSFENTSEGYNLLFGLLNDKYARIWMLCYGFIVCICMLVLGATAFQIIYDWDTSYFEPNLHQNKRTLIVILIAFDLISLCLVLVMFILQFSLLSHSYIYKLYHFCGRFIIFYNVVTLITGIIVSSKYDSINITGFIVAYLIGYDLWYIAADILDCDGMDNPSTRIYAFGFNFAVASVLFVIGFVYFTITVQSVYWDDTTAEQIFWLINAFAGLGYVLIFLIMTGWSTIRINKIKYNIIGREQCYYLSKNVFNLLCIQLWTKCIHCNGITSCLLSCGTQRAHVSRMKSYCDRRFYACCACGCISSDHGYYGGSRSEDVNPDADGGNSCFSKTMKVLSVLLVSMSGVWVVQRAYSLYIFWRAFVLILDVNSQTKLFFQTKEKVNRRG